MSSQIQTDSSTKSTPSQPKPKEQKPFLIGITGGSGSGKTTVAYFISEFLGPENCLLFSLDNYFFGPNDEERKHIEDYNFDRPEALDMDLAYKHLTELLEGKTIDMPVYNFNFSKRMPYTNKVSPRRVIIFEGIFAFVEKRIRDLMGLKIFVDLDSDMRLIRRIKRDISARSRVIDTVINRYITFVKPAFDQYILPMKKFANIVIPQINPASLAEEIVSYHLKHTLLSDLIDDKKKNNMDLTIERKSSSYQFFFDTENIKILTVNSPNDIKKFSDILYNIIKNKKGPYHELYKEIIIEKLLEIHNEAANKEKLPCEFLFLNELENEEKKNEILKKIEINKEGGREIIIAIFLPCIIYNQKMPKIKEVIQEFKKYENVKFEIISVFLSRSAFDNLNKGLEEEKIKYDIITIYFGDNLLSYENFLNKDKTDAVLEESENNEVTEEKEGNSARKERENNKKERSYLTPEDYIEEFRKQINQKEKDE